MSETANTWQHKYITTNGVKLHYVTQGTVPLMLMFTRVSGILVFLAALNTRICPRFPSCGVRFARL
jgi:hypothetical protein